MAGPTVKTLVEERAALVSEIEPLMLKAAANSLTDEDRQALAGLKTRSTALLGQIKQAKSDDAAIAEIGDMFKGVPGLGLNGTGRMSDGWAKSIVGFAEAKGVKTLLTTSGSIEIPNLLSETILRNPLYGGDIWPLLNVSSIDSRTFTYLRQTIRENNAAPVAEGGTKPTSNYGLEDAEGRTVTIAHVSQQIPRQALADFSNLERFVEMELEYGLRWELDFQIIAGPGTGENFEGILNTSGIQTQPSTGDRLSTCRKAITRLEALGVIPTAFVMAPEEWETLELQRDNDDRFMLDNGASLPVDTAKRQLWGVPVRTSPRIGAGRTLLGNYKSADLLVRENIRIDWSENTADDFVHNLFRARCEGRFGIRVSQPFAFVDVELSDVPG